MTIDIDHLTETQFIDLNRRVVERLKFLAQMRAHARMLDLQGGGRPARAPRRTGRRPVQAGRRRPTASA